MESTQWQPCTSGNGRYAFNENHDQFRTAHAIHIYHAIGLQFHLEMKAPLYTRGMPLGYLMVITPRGSWRIYAPQHTHGIGTGDTCDEMRHSAGWDGDECRGCCRCVSCLQHCTCMESATALLHVVEPASLNLDPATRTQVFSTPFNFINHRLMISPTDTVRLHLALLF
jgi:hypothetical protein